MSNSYCILLPVDTPLFAHVKWAAQRWFQYYGIEGVAIISVPSGGFLAGPNDLGIRTQLLKKHYKTPDGREHTVLAGIFDPWVVFGDEKCHILASIVDKPAFLLVSPRDYPFSYDRFRLVKHMAVNGPANVPNGLAHPHGYVSSSWAMAYNLNEVMSALMGSNTSTAKTVPPAKQTPAKTQFYEMSRFNFGEDMQLDCNGKPQLVLTVDYLSAIKAQLSDATDANLLSIPKLFPEWSQTMLSALIATKDTLSEHCDLINAVIAAIQTACLDLRLMDRENLVKILMGLYPQGGGNAQDDSVFLRKRSQKLAEFLIDDEFIPCSVQPRKPGLLFSEALWKARLLDCLVFRDARLANLSRDDLGSGGNQHPKMHTAHYTSAASIIYSKMWVTERVEDIAVDDAPPVVESDASPIINEMVESEERQPVN